MSEGSTGQLPAGWAIAPLGNILEVVRGVTYRKEDSRTRPEEGYVPVLRANNIQEHLLFEDLVYVPPSNVSASQMLRPGDVLVAASSGSRSVVGKAAQLKEQWYGAFGAFCFALRPATEIEQRFLGWFLHTKEYRNRVSELSAGININNLRPEHVEDTPLRLAPRNEQSRIADALDELLSDLDAAVAALERARAKLKLYRASVLKAAVEGALTAEWRAQHPTVAPASELLNRILAERRCRLEKEQLIKLKAKGQEPPKDRKAKDDEPVAADTTELPPVPSGWVVASMDELTVRVTSGSRDWQQFYGTGPGTFIMAQNVRPGRLDLTSRQAVNPPSDDSSCERSLVEEGDLLVTIVGANTGDVCRVADALSEHYVCQSVALMRPADSRIARFLDCYCNSDGGAQRHYRRYLYGAGRPHLSFDQLKMTPVLLPPLEEQEAIVELVEDQMSVIDHLEADIDAKLKSTQSLRQAILRHAFSGKLVAQDPNDEPAAELLKRIASEREARAGEAKRSGKPRQRRARGN